MKILNFGSCCIDNVYSVPHFVAPGETLASTHFDIYPGGKGLNQSIALSRAGATVMHAGKVGKDGVWLKELMSESGVDESRVTVIDGPSGHANIQITPEGENAIVIVGGSNREITPADFELAFSGLNAGDFLLLQNEVSHLNEIIEHGSKLGLRIVFNAAPMDTSVLDLPLDLIEYLLVNETEAAALAETSDLTPAILIETLANRYPEMKIVLTLGAAGAIYVEHNDDAIQQIQQPAFSTKAIDTTGAGDTFTGFFLAALIRGAAIEECLREACLAASISVTRPGAATSIPHQSELQNAAAQ
jgi:ribokinase